VCVCVCCVCVCVCVCVRERERERAVVALFEPICAAHIGSLGALIALEFEL
jgi:hypothetical protein